MPTKTTEQTTVGELVPQPHGGALRNGGTNKGGPGRTPNELRQLARQSMPRAIERATEILEADSDSGAIIRAGEFLSKLAVPSQSEIIEVKDDQLIQAMFKVLGEMAQAKELTKEAIESFKTRFEAEISR